MRPGSTLQWGLDVRLGLSVGFLSYELVSLVLGLHLMGWFAHGFEKRNYNCIVLTNSLLFKLF